MPFRAGLLLIYFAARALAQPEPPEDHYIEDTFKARIGEVPQLGWYDSARGFLATTSAPQVTIYGPLGMARTGQRKGELSATELGAVQKWGLACELAPQDKVSAYQTGPSVETDRALYTTKPLPGTSRSGLVSIPLDSERLAAVNRALGWPASGALRRDEAIAARADSFFYSLHKLYSSTGLLRQEAIILHGKPGQIIALDLRRDMNTAAYCDGCRPPTYFDGTFVLYKPLNVFELAGFPYPVLLTDSGTFEGRALSLLTFTPEGKLTQFRTYEYVFHCG